MIHIPYVQLGLDNQELEPILRSAISAVVASGGYILGCAVQEFEERLADLHGLPHAVGLGSGFDALALTLEALGVGPGDEVITVPNSFIATAAAIAALGARPVFVDVDEDQTMDPVRLAEAITPRTKVILPVHLTGRPAPMEAIMKLADAARIHVVEDCAQAIGAGLNRKPVGSFGIAGCYSFHPLKNLAACGDGGAVVTRDKELCDQLRFLRNHGLQDRNTCLRWGRNSRLDTLQAAILNAKLPQLPVLTDARRRNAAYYHDCLGDLPIRMPQERPGEHCVWHAFVVQTPLRDSLQAFLLANGIEALVHYPVPIHLQPAARSLGYPEGSLPICENQAKSILSLPIRPSLSGHEVSCVAAVVRRFFEGH